MLRYVTRRVLLMIPTLFILYTLLFALMRVIPGDIVDLFLEGGTVNSGPELEAQKATLRRELGIDKSLPEQYGIAVLKMMTGDMGNSMQSRRPVTEEIIRRAPITIELAVLASITAIGLAIPAGIISAARQRSFLDQSVRLWAILTLSIPNFWLGTMVVLLPAIWWGYGAPPVYRSLLEDPWSNLQQLLPAALVLGLSFGGTTTRFVRSSLLEVLRQDYIRTAWSKGLNEARVMQRHALKNALIPVVTIIGLQLGGLFGGAVITEAIFNIPGLGTLTLASIRERDYTQLQANMLLFGGVVAFMSLLVDISYAWLDPRIRYS
ncbi:MAG: ABC transporter permease [Chloroflexi bacterium]|nr:ABC transporter permease [Chloroflexota bacterium]